MQKNDMMDCCFGIICTTSGDCSVVFHKITAPLATWGPLLINHLGNKPQQYLIAQCVMVHAILAL